MNVLAAFEGEERRSALLQRVESLLGEEFPAAKIEFAPLDHSFHIWFDEAQTFAEQRLQNALERLSKEDIVSFCSGLLTDEAPLDHQPALLKTALACRAAQDAGLDYLAYDQLGAYYEAGLRGWVGLGRAIAENRILLSAQEIQSVHPKGLDRQFEVLMQVFDEAGKTMPLEQILSHVERNGGIAKLDRWLLRTVIVGYGAALRQHPHISLSLNVSGLSISRPGFWPFMQALLHESGVAVQQLQIEITETAQINNIDIARENVTALREAGIDVAIDDFGAAFSGSYYLSILPVNVVKIDGALVSLISDPSKVQNATAIIRAIVTMCHELGMSVVAEYVESHEIAALLRAFGVDKLQGFALAKPRPLKQVFA